MYDSISSDSTSPTLLGRAKQCDGDAWNKLSQLYAPRIYAWARRAGLQEADAVDVGQEVFRLLATKLPEFDRRRSGSFRKWLFRATQYVLKEHFRRQAKRPEPIGELTAFVPFQEFESTDDPSSIEGPDSQRAFLRRLMDFLCHDFEEHTWQIFWRSAVEGQATADLAAEFAMSPKAVRQAKYRVLQRLRREMGELF